MRVCGIICEYNPFHNGHAYHLQEARRLSGADYVICVMSGPITQRGTFARHEKWSRTQAALRSGADLVLELPVRFACAPSGEFAGGGLTLLQCLHVVTHFSFGCEASSLPDLEAVSALYKNEEKPYRDALRIHLDNGLSYPVARAQAAEDVLEMTGLASRLSEPNTVLALEYLTHIPEDITPVPVARKGAGYHDLRLSGYASATGIRSALEQGELADVLSCVPFPHLLQEQEEQLLFHAPDALDSLLLYRLRTMDALELSQIAGMNEGLEHRFLGAARQSGTREELLQNVKTRRYAYSRLSRITAAILLQMTQEFAASHSVPEYARVLGFRASARPLLHEIKERASIPLLTKCASFSSPLFEKDVLAQDLWALGCQSPGMRTPGRDFVTSPQIL